MLNPYKKADVSFEWIRDLDEQGCFSRVYLAHDEHLDYDLVIKEIKKEENTNPDDYFSEARMLYKNAHPNIVQVQYAAQCDRNIYIAMPFYYNGSLNQLMQIKNLTCREIIRYSIHFLSGLYHIHSKGLMHFDIKPNNIMLSNRDEAMLSDFGLSQLINEESRATPQFGYNFHMPPEYFALSSNDYNFTFDIYQACLTLYRMCVGYHQFEAERAVFSTIEQLKNAIIDGSYPLRQFPAHIHKKLISIVNKCIHIDPNQRYQSVLDILNDLSAINDGALDWRLQTAKPVNGTYEWQKELDGAILSLVFDSESASTTGKRLYPDSRQRRVTDLAITSGCTHAKLYKLLKDN
ncbi:serine/threonine-protein kinase [Klebsiella pneumoniae]|nr:serine/threonine-protein kinase [Klebsiella pneumoniae]